MRTRVTRMALATVLALVAACAGDRGVDSSSARPLPPRVTTDEAVVTDAAAVPAPATTERALSTAPATSPPAASVPTTSEPDPAMVEPPVVTAPPATIGPSPDDLVGQGDTLYPDLGNPGLDVQSYLVRISYDPAEAVIHGHVTITALVTENADQIVLDAGEMVIGAVQVDGVDAAFDKRPDELVVAHPVSADQVVAIDVAYEDGPTSTSGATGLDVGWFATPGGSYVLNEPDALHSWLPSVDHPIDKATWRFEITVPDGASGIANGVLVSQTSEAGQSTWVWEQAEPMATYLVQLLTGQYQVLDGGTAGTVPLINVALAADVERMQPYFDATAAQLAFFEEWFGPYPLSHYGIAITESYPGLAMETQGRSMFSRLDFPGPLGANQQLLLSHELAHQWFGDAVSPADWGSLWLNESFASYAQWMWFDHIGLDTLDDQAEFALQARHAIGSESTGRPTVDNLFGLERYDGGAVVVHALRATIGDDAFFALLRRWVADHDGTSRRNEDFIALAEEVSGTDLDAFFDTWLYAVDLPATYPG